MADDLPDQGLGRLVDDAQIAMLLSMSRSFIRKQRFLRRRGRRSLATASALNPPEDTER